MASRKSTQPAQAQPAETNGQPPAEEGVVTVTNAEIVPARPMPVVRSADIKLGKTQKGQYAKLVDGDKSIMGYITLTDRSLDDLEKVVVRGLAGFIKAGEALLEIRARKLFEEAGFTSFVAYGMDRFGLSKARLYQLVDIAQVSAILAAAGEPLPSITKRMEPMGRLKDDPQKLIEVNQALREASPTGDVADVPQTVVADAVADAANENGKGLVANRQEREAREAEALALAKAVTDDEEDEEEADLEEGEEEEDGEETDEAPAPRQRASTGPRQKVSVAPSLGPTTEEQALTELITVINGFKGGRYANMYPRTLRAVQEIAGLSLAYLAQEWKTEKVGNKERPIANRPIDLTIAKPTAKRLVAMLKQTQAEERAKREADEAVARKKEAAAAKKTADEQAKTAAGQHRAAVADGAKRIEEGEVIQPEDPALVSAYAIVDAMQEWQRGGKQGQSPFTGTDLRRATEFLDAVTATEEDEAEEEEVDEEEEETTTEEQDLQDSEAAAAAGEEEETDEAAGEADDDFDFDLEEEAAPAGGR